eukprot:gnl/Dysnectes_brevis/79_a97_15970.p1 GENE.gnl/Dysnectes_brevis/79_a97_15970~~gnl/Dysnectes_brevis/79_a97_15970.p1  ORF type:complete len:123 (+),score=34.45 gnl/Dysnectes_brevis/79_a97_15970:54-422(+)
MSDANLILVILINLILPGIGTYYMGQKKKGLAIFLTMIVIGVIRWLVSFILVGILNLITIGYWITMIITIILVIIYIVDLVDSFLVHKLGPAGIDGLCAVPYFKTVLAPMGGILGVSMTGKD